MFDSAAEYVFRTRPMIKHFQTMFDRRETLPVKYSLLACSWPEDNVQTLSKHCLTISGRQTMFYDVAKRLNNVWQANLKCLTNNVSNNRAFTVKISSLCCLIAQALTFNSRFFARLVPLLVVRTCWNGEGERWRWRWRWNGVLAPVARISEVG